MRARWWRAAHSRSNPHARSAPAGTDAAAGPDADPYPGEQPPPHLSDLLHDVRDLRMTLAADLSAAAGATEHGAHDVAGQIVDADRREVAAFRRRAVERLAALDAAGPEQPAVAVRASARSWRRRIVVSLPAIPLAGALAMSAAAAAGLLPVPGHTSHRAVTPGVQAAGPATTALDQFEQVLRSDPNASQVISAATALHKQIAALLASAPQDPSHVREVARLLQLEQALLLRTQPPGSNVVLAASHRLAARLLKLGPQVATSQSAAAPVSTSQPQSTPSHHAQSTSSSTPTPTAPSTASPKPTPTSTHTSSPAPSSSSSSDYPNNLPGLHN